MRTELERRSRAASQRHWRRLRRLRREHGVVLPPGRPRLHRPPKQCDSCPFAHYALCHAFTVDSRNRARRAS
jgi:hypothetical protein